MAYESLWVNDSRHPHPHGIVPEEDQLGFDGDDYVGFLQALSMAEVGAEGGFVSGGGGGLIAEVKAQGQGKVVVFDQDAFEQLVEWLGDQMG